MAKTQTQRRETKTRSHQSIKASEVAATKKRRKIDWTRVIIVTVGIIVILSMVLSLFKF